VEKGGFFLAGAFSIGVQKLTMQTIDFRQRPLCLPFKTRPSHNSAPGPGLFPLFWPSNLPFPLPIPGNQAQALFLGRSIGLCIFAIRFCRSSAPWAFWDGAFSCFADAKESEEKRFD